MSAQDQVSNQASNNDPVAQALKQRLQDWSQRNGADAKAVFAGSETEQSRAAAEALATPKTPAESPAEIEEIAEAPAPEALGPQTPSSNQQDGGAVSAQAGSGPESNPQTSSAVTNAVEAQSLTGDRALDALLSDAQKLLLVQAIQTLQVLQKEDEQARAVAATLTDRQKTALLGLLRTLEEVQADQAEGQQGFSPEQREAIVEVLTTLETEQKAIERARVRQQEQANKQARAGQGNQRPAAPAQTRSGLAPGLLSPAQEAALASGLTKLRNAERVQAEGGDVQAALDMSAEERQALLAVIQVIERLQGALGEGQGVSDLSAAQRQELVTAVTRLQAAQERRASGQTRAVAQAQAPASGQAATPQTATAARAPDGPLSGGLYGLVDDKREINSDLAIADHKDNGFSFGRNRAIWTTILRSSGQLDSGLSFRSGSIVSNNWEIDYGVDVVGTLSNVAEQVAPLDSYKIAPDITVLRRLTDRINLKVQGQAEFVPNAGAMLGSTGLVYSQGIVEVAGNVSAKYEYLANPNLPASDPQSEIDATTLSADLGIAVSEFVLGPTSTDASAILVLSQVLGQDPTLTFNSKVVSKLTNEMSLTDRIAKARADYIEYAGAAQASAGFGPRRQPVAARPTAARPVDDIFAPEGQPATAAQAAPVATVAVAATGPSFDDVFAPEGSVGATSVSPSLASLSKLVAVDSNDLPYDLRETTGRNFINQLTRLGYSDQKMLQASLDRGSNGLVTGRLEARVPHILSPSLVGEARLAYAGQYVPTTIFGSSDPMFLQELGGRLMTAWQAAERTTLAGRISASLDNQLDLSATGFMVEATQTLAPYASTSLKFSNSNSYSSGLYLQSLNEVRASLRYRDDRFGEFTGSVGRQFDQNFEPGAYVASAAYAKGVRNVLTSGRDALFEAGLELRYDPQTDTDPEVGAFVKATIELN